MSGRSELSSELITRIVTLSDAGHKTKEISELTGASGRNIRRWVARYKEEGTNPKVSFWEAQKDE